MLTTLTEVNNKDGSGLAIRTTRFAPQEGVSIEETTQNHTRHMISVMSVEEADIVIEGLNKWKESLKS